jgi:hypothetical protein
LSKDAFRAIAESAGGDVGGCSRRKADDEVDWACARPWRTMLLRFG